jgi:hypothetical protein
MRRNQLGLKASNVVLSTLVVAIFIYLLILAMAQDQVVEKLSRGTGFANYSSSLLDAREAKKLADRVDSLAEDRQKLRKQLATLEQQATVAKLEYEREAPRLDAIFEKFDGTEGCQIRNKPKPAGSEASRQELEQQAQRSELAAARLCFAVSPGLGGDARMIYMGILDNAQRLSDEMVRTDLARKAKDAERKTLSDEITRQVNDRNRLAPARVQFTMLESLETPHWFPTNFVNYPPFIVRVLLSFFSGTFGALLVTMVFVVYPSKLRERVSAKLYYKRVFLGGLVALTVFIVLTGGASILGGSEASQDNTNVMSFTAIGLLAGMFSDTVADWLSARAKTMFSTEDENDDEDRANKADGRETAPSTPSGSGV